MSEREFAGVQPAEEDLMVTGVDCDLELADLLRLRSDEHISTLGVRGLGAERAATKQPHRMTGQHGAISLSSKANEALGHPFLVCLFHFLKRNRA